MNVIKTSVLFLSAFVLIALPISDTTAWEGHDNDTGNSIDVESYDHQGEGEGEVEYYDYDSGEYRSGYLDMQPGGSGELTDDETGETHDVDME